MRTCHRSFVAVALFGGCTLVANAQIITNDTSFPGSLGDFRLSLPDPTYAHYGVTLTGLDLTNFGTSIPLPSGTTSSVTTSFNFLGMFNAAIPYSGIGSVSLGITDLGAGVYSTQMTALNLTGTAGGHNVQMGQTATGTGHETVIPLGGGMFQINSFFDVFTELSIDGGVWSPQQDQTLATHFDLKPPAGTPEPFTIALGFAGVGLALRRRFIKS